MNLDYYCFPTSTGNISDFTNLEQYDFLHEKEYYASRQTEVLSARDKEKLLLFDLENRIFVDADGKKVDIEGKVIFPRSTIQQELVLLSTIRELKGISIVTEQDTKMVQKWFHKVKTKREFKLTTFSELEKNVSSYRKEYGETVFVKTVKKGYSGITWLMEAELESRKIAVLFDDDFRTLRSRIRNFDAQILVYKEVNPLQDRFGKREWRAFVLDNQLYSLSRASNRIVPVEKYVYEEVNKKIQELKGTIPSCYTIDFFEYREDGKRDTIFDVYEINSIITSRTFENNNLVT